MPRTHGIEEYLEGIYILNAEGVTVLPSILAEYLDVARPTVTQTVQRLTASGYVASGEGKELVLSDKGRERAEAVVRRHRLLERWLTDELGMDWADAHVEAGRLEHAVSEMVEERLMERLGHPTTCPHGNVIPGTGAEQLPGQPLTTLTESPRAVVVRIVEQAEEDLELLRFLHRAGLVPGAEIEIASDRSPYEAGVMVIVNGESIALEEAVARRILVKPD